jgi:imidazolonepropionase-like amidohydrolase
MTPAQTLDAATRSPAEFLGPLATEGTIEPERRANFVLLDRNPLNDIANTREVAVVILRGRVLRVR